MHGEMVRHPRRIMGRKSSEFGVPATDSQINVKGMVVDRVVAGSPKELSQEISANSKVIECFSCSLRMVQLRYETNISCVRSTRFYPFNCNVKKP